MMHMDSQSGWLCYLREFDTFGNGIEYAYPVIGWFEETNHEDATGTEWSEILPIVVAHGEVRVIGVAERLEWVGIDSPIWKAVCSRDATTERV